MLALVGALGGCAQRAAPAAETPADGIDGGVGGIGVRNMFVLGLLGFTTMPRVVEVAWSRALVI